MDAQTEARTYSFVTLSTVIHVAMAIGVMFLKVQIEPSPKDLTQVEIISASHPVVAASAVSQAPIVAETSKADATVPQEVRPAVVTNTLDEASPVVVAKQKPIAHHSKTKAAAVPVTRKAVVQAKPAPAPIPAELPEVENTDLESPTAEAQTDLKEEDIADDLSKIDQEQNAKVAAVHEDLNKETEKELKDQEAKFAAIEKENNAESEKMAQENAAKRAKEKQELAAQQQQAKAMAAAAAARAQAAQEAELAKQAQAAQQAEQARIQAEKNAAAMAAIAAAASQSKSTDEVRALEDLRQMPGNQRPQYDAQDRLNQRQGEVAFLAYVSREGSIVNFKMTKSSGHRELDAKTLKAIKNWRFYPGQEGWVEIPFKWDLKGGPQEMPTTLRRRAQVGQN